jgi:aspartate kinase
MNVVVQKYGGSSVADLDRIRRVAERVVATRATGTQVVVVVSAMGNTTNELLDMARSLSSDPSRRELDMLLSVGERITMALLSTAIRELGHEAVSLTGSQCGILTNDSHANARIIEIRPFRVLDELEKGKIVIVAGYQGTSYRREITTLGRGGSDTTAVALAAALGATTCDIFSDVDGVYTADPRIVVSAQRLQDVSYEEMLELSRHGARVLNAQAIEFARNAGIAVYARSSFGSDESTVIRRIDGAPERGLAGLGVRGVTGSRNRLMVRYNGLSTGENRSLDLLEYLGDLQVVAATASPQNDRMSVLVATENIPDVSAWAARVRREYPDLVAVLTGLGTVAAVGNGIGANPAIFVRAVRRLQASNIPVSWNYTSRDAVCVVVRDAAVDDAVRLLHAEFIESRETAEPDAS